VRNKTEYDLINQMMNLNEKHYRTINNNNNYFTYYSKSNRNERNKSSINNPNSSLVNFYKHKMNNSVLNFNKRVMNNNVGKPYIIINNEKYSRNKNISNTIYNNSKKNKKYMFIKNIVLLNLMILKT